VETGPRCKKLASGADRQVDREWRDIFPKSALSEWQNHGHFRTCITFGLMHAREPVQQQGKDVNKHRILGRPSYSALVFSRFDVWGFEGREGKLEVWRAPQQKGRK
jgi:hypothetical protein